MHIIHNTDKRSGITYAYESISYWDKELKKTRSKRKLIGRVDKDTGEIVPTDGRCRKNSPYQKVEKTRRDEIMDRIRPMGLAELRKEVIRLELALDALKQRGSAGGSD
jgi:hypothetical protein